MAKKKAEKPGLMAGSVAAGFPSPAEQYVEAPLDLNVLLVRKPAATFFVRAAGDFMVGAGIRSGDILWLNAAWQLPTIPSSSPPWTTNSPSTHRAFLPAVTVPPDVIADQMPPGIYRKRIRPSGTPEEGCIPPALI